jgi:hypothetical protein
MAPPETKRPKKHGCARPNTIWSGNLRLVIHWGSPVKPSETWHADLINEYGHQVYFRHGVRGILGINPFIRSQVRAPALPVFTGYRIHRNNAGRSRTTLSATPSSTTRSSDGAERQEDWPLQGNRISTQPHGPSAKRTKMTALAVCLGARPWCRRRHVPPLHYHAIPSPHKNSRRTDPRATHSDHLSVRRNWAGVRHPHPTALETDLIIYL